jgi:hypothetical protein
MSAEDQTFSAENFKVIWDQETRRGRDLRRFSDEVAAHIDELKSLRKLKKEALAPHPLNSESRRNVLIEFAEKRETAVSAKRSALATATEQFSLEAASRIDEGRYGLDLVEVGIRNKKQAYRIEFARPADFFLVKQLERNLVDAFQLSSVDRHQMVTQLSILLADSSPKSVLKADLASFFESIPHSILLERLDSERSFSRISHAFVKQLLADYSRLSGSPKGLPRGVGLSSFLAEAYLRDFDNAVRRMPGVTYYSRYVDDMILVSNHKSHDKAAETTRPKIRILLKALGLSLNPTKTRSYTSNDVARFRIINLLGYEFRANLRAGTVALDMSPRRFKRYRSRIDLAFDRHAIGAKSTPGADTALVNRIRLLTGNYRSPRPAGSVMMGIHFSNRSLRSTSVRLRELDKILLSRASSAVVGNPARERMAELTFADGFSAVRFERFSRSHIDKLSLIWRFVGNDE